MKAMILAAGRGSRMQPLTNHTPKPLLKIGGKPLIVWHIEKLQQAGFKEIIINVAWLGDQIIKTLGDGSQFGVKLIYSNEQQEGALETAGGIIKALPQLSKNNDPFLVVNGDVWCDFSVSNQSPLKPNDLAHLILVNNPEHNPEGDFALNKNRVTQGIEIEEAETDADAEEKKERKNNKYTFSGIGFYHPDLFKNLPQGKQALAPLLRQTMDNHQVSGELFKGDWRDIGTPERLRQLNSDLKNS